MNKVIQRTNKNIPNGVDLLVLLNNDSHLGMARWNEMRKNMRSSQALDLLKNFIDLVPAVRNSVREAVLTCPDNMVVLLTFDAISCDTEVRGIHLKTKEFNLLLSYVDAANGKSFSRKVTL